MIEINRLIKAELTWNKDYMGNETEVYVDPEEAKLAAEKKIQEIAFRVHESVMQAIDWKASENS